MDTPLLSFSARVVTGSGRGKRMGSGTMNLDLSMVPNEMSEGVYACIVTIDDVQRHAVMHYGPRPVFHDTRSCEVHVLDALIEESPATLTVTVVEKLRDVADFPSKDDLVTQIRHDIEKARAILGTYGSH